MWKIRRNNYEEIRVCGKYEGIPLTILRLWDLKKFRDLQLYVGFENENILQALPQGARVAVGPQLS